MRQRTVRWGSGRRAVPLGRVRAHLRAVVARCPRERGDVCVTRGGALQHESVSAHNGAGDGRYVVDEERACRRA